MCPKKEYISQLVDGVLHPKKASKVKKHIRKCSQCKKIYEEQKKIGRVLAQVKLSPTSPCLGPNEFLFLLEDRSHKHRDLWEEHLLHCRKCRDDFLYLQSTQDIIEIEDDSALQPLPANVYHRISQLVPAEVEFSSSSLRVLSSPKRKSLRYYRQRKSPLPQFMAMAAAILIMVFLGIMLAVLNQPSSQPKRNHGIAKNNLPQDTGQPLAPRNKLHEEHSPLTPPVRPGKTTSHTVGGQGDKTPHNNTKTQNGSKNPTSIPGYSTVKDPKETASPSKPTNTKGPKKESTSPDSTATPPVKTIPSNMGKTHPRHEEGRGLQIALLKGTITASGKNLMLKEGAKSLVLPKQKWKVQSKGAVIQIGSKNLICLQKNSVLSLGRLSQQPSIYLYKGTAYFSFLPHQGKKAPLVQTKQAYCQVLGTEFQVESKGFTTYLTVAAGKVRFQSRKTNRFIDVGSGKRAYMTNKFGPYWKKGDFQKGRIFRWATDLLPKRMAFFPFDFQTQNSIWNGWIINSNTYKKSVGALRALMFSHPHFGVHAGLAKSLFTFYGSPQYKIQFAYWLSQDSPIQIRLFNITQGKHYIFNQSSTKSQEWLLLKVRLNEFQAEDGSQAKIRYGDVLGDIEILAGNPQNKRSFQLLIDNFEILR